MEGGDPAVIASGLPHVAFTYGELAVQELVHAVQWLVSNGRLPPGASFVDLGSGSGKLVFAMALIGCFARCTGVELLPTLASMASTAQRVWESSSNADIVAARRGVAVACLQGDFLRDDWSHADVAFCHSLCYNRALMRKLAEHGASMHNGAVLLTTSRLPEEALRWFVLDAVLNDFDVLDAGFWECESVYVYRRDATRG